MKGPFHRLIALFLLAAALLTHVGCGCESRSLRVLSYNIHHGQGMDEKFDLQRLARVISEVRPDLVSLQEVDRRTSRSRGVDQAAELARLTGMHHVYGPAMDFAGGEYGVAILSRFPILASDNHALPHSPGFEPRTVLTATVEYEPGRQVLFVATHLQHNSEDDRTAQAREICRILVEETAHDPPPMILAGDLNAQPTSTPMAIFTRFWRACDDRAQPTFPSVDPNRKIDYVLVWPRDYWEVLEVVVLSEPIASDHCPLLVVLRRVGADRD